MKLPSIIGTMLSRGMLKRFLHLPRMQQKTLTEILLRKKKKNITLKKEPGEKKHVKSFTLSSEHCGEAGNTTVIGTQLYFTSVERYKHGGHVVRAFWRERKTCFVLSRVVT